MVRAVGAAGSYLAELFSRFASKVGTAMLAMVGSACESESSAKVAPTPAAMVVEAPVAEPAPKDDGPIGEFDITFYFVASEEDVAAKIAKKQAEAAAKVANDNVTTELAAIAPEPPAREIVPLYDVRTCEVLAEVDKEFARQMTLQGTGRLKDGRLLGVGGGQNCSCERSPCFHVVEGVTWGTAGNGRPLAPFRTVAVDPKVVKLGSLLYVPLLEGRTMPGRAPWGGFVHDGCVVADDTGGGIKGFQLDLFVGRRGYYLGLSGSGGHHAWARHVQVFDGSKRCERKGRHIGRKTGAI